MKKQLLLLSLLLLSCKGNTTSVSSSKSDNTSSLTSFTSDTISSKEESSSINSSSENNKESTSNESSSSESSSLEFETLTLKEAKEKIKSLNLTLNEVDVALSNFKVKIQGKVLSRQDVVTTKKGYGSRYKLCILDNSDYFYVQINDAHYKSFENKIGNSYEFIGNLATYCGEEEIILESYTQIDDLQVDLASIAIKYNSIQEIHEKLQTINTNCKGIACSSLISFNAKYIGIHDDKLLLFSDGKQLILVHTRDKVKNSLTLNSSYLLYATLNMYYYRPSLEYIAHEKSEDIDISSLKNNAKEITAETLYRTKLYDKDNDKSNKYFTEYSSLYQYMYHFKGYLDYYIKNNNYYIVLTDTLSIRNTIWTQENAKANKALFVVNDYYYNISEYQFENAPYYQDYIESKQIDIYFSLDLYNTNNYYSIFIL